MSFSFHSFVKIQFAFKNVSINLLGKRLAATLRGRPMQSSADRSISRASELGMESRQGHKFLLLSKMAHVDVFEYRSCDSTHACQGCVVGICDSRGG